MQLGNLLKGVSVKSVNADISQDIKDVKINSGQVGEGDIFICLEGGNFDGHDFAPEAAKKGAVIIAEKQLNFSCPNVVVEDTRKAYSLISQNYFGRPAERLKIISVVGTNGKTSTSHILQSVLSYAGIQAGVIGTLGHSFMGEHEDATLTTPDPYKLNELFKNMADRGAEVAIVEVSAHAIAWDKLYGITAEIAILTNVTQDHLDFFSSFEEYAETKLSYFEPDTVRLGVINVDDEWGRRLAKKATIPIVTYGLENPSDVFAIDVRPDIDGVSFVLNLFDDIIDVKSPLYGYFNVYNLVSAMTVAKLLKLPSDTILKAVKRIKEVEGRFNILKNNKGVIIIDYAHTPDGLKNLLTSARMLTKGQLITVFGCGGNRDKTKRPIMGQIASEYSDSIVITSDNPRYEPPIDIMHDIEKGVTGRYKLISNRAEAITYAMQTMMEGDTVVIAGKGAEKYIEVEGERKRYSDYDVVYRRGGRRD